ncbi:MAG: thiamine pyrophosphate-binding protein, partial [Alphaproteobacteria bacterium]|nr:thiamine pyrophosphate-binding protein [Alphaproteobacteria bacterium]
MKIRLSDYLADFVAGMGVRSVYAVTGGGAMFLNDALGFHRDFGMVCFHHEQSAAMAAEGEARITGRPGVVHVTSGPGGTNALTGVAGAWIDSIPMLGISGQASLPTTIGTSGLRQRGVQEIDIVSIMKPVTKYAVMVEKAEDIRHHLEKAVHEAVSGKPGPTWIDVPTDIQVAMIDPAALPSFKPEAAPKVDLGPAIRQALDLIRSAERPVLIPGYGIRSAGAVEAFRELAEKLHIPIVPSWNAADIVASDNPFHIGRAGIFGDRAGNFAVQNADLLICLGSRMSVPQTGYNEKTFAREAKRIVVDIDPRELAKPTLRPDLPIAADVGAVIRGLLAALGNVQRSPKLDAWVAKCRDWQRRYPVVLPEYRAITDKVNSYVFVERLAAKLPADAAIVTDMGTSFTCTMQTFATRQGQRLFTSSGLAAMGFGLPGAIGVCCARGRKPT